MDVQLSRIAPGFPGFPAVRAPVLPVPRFKLARLPPGRRGHPDAAAPFRREPRKGQKFAMKQNAHKFHKRTLKLEEINRLAREDPEGFAARESDTYLREVEALARYLAVGFDSHCLVMLSGPSSSGKTTTALILRDRLREMGVDAHTVSMDDFYRGREQAPRLPDGSFDYEALEALRLDTLEECMRDLLQKGCAQIPHFDFHAGKPAEETRELCIQPNSVVIFEGIHAINPYFEQHLPSENLFKIFVNTITPIYQGAEKRMARRDLRLIRRLLRDERFRSSPVENTLNMWAQVVRGENEYMFPYVDTVDYVVDTTHAFEVNAFAPLLLPSLRAVPSDSPHAPAAGRLAAKLEAFVPVSLDVIPRDCLLREFVGDGIY